MLIIWGRCLYIFSITNKVFPGLSHKGFAVRRLNKDNFGVASLIEYDDGFKMFVSIFCIFTVDSRWVDPFDQIH